MKWISALVAGMLSILFLSATRTEAFSLLGPFEPWMTTSNGFYPGPSAEIGGPMEITNEYRWNVPVLTYGFDQSFLDFFGSNGVAAVESAVQILNSLPPASQIDPNSYPIAVTGQNYAAQSLGLVDLKSETLSLLVQQLGLAPPAAFTFCLRDFWVTNGTIAGDVLVRNFDPITDLPTNYVNSVALTYQLQSFSSGQETNAYVVISPVNPQDSLDNTVADGVPEQGDYFGGMTRDDVGGLRYLLSSNNVNYETLLPGVIGAGTNANSFVNGAWRPGIEKITFLAEPIDPLTGRFYSPVTNEFTDTYITNGTVMQQQVARVIDRPDILFSAADLSLGHFDSSGGPYIARTGTTNWINNALLNGHLSGAGPGNIQPPIVITFNKLGRRWLDFPGGNSVFEQSTRWGTFDGSTNPPIIYPQSQMETNQTSLHFWLLGNNFHEFDWLLSGAASTAYSFETSTNLVNWNTLFVITNDGSVYSFDDQNVSSEQRFYRFVPQ